MSQHQNDFQKLASSLRQISNKAFQVESSGVLSHWYQGDDSTDFFFWTDDRGVIYKQQLVMKEQIIEWDLITGVHTGSVQEDFRERIGSGGSPVIELDEALDRELVNQAVEMMKLAEQIPADQRLKFVENFKSDRTISKMTEKELIFFFGRPQDQSKSEKSFFARMQQWLLK